MNSPTKTLSALALGGLLAGTAIAGPGDAYTRFALPKQSTNPVSIALYQSDSQQPMRVMTETSTPAMQTKLIYTGNPKNTGLATRVFVTSAE